MGSAVMETAQLLARSQHGLVSRKQLCDAGIPATTIQSRMESAFIFPVFRGVYLVGRPSLSIEGLRIAAVMAVGSGSIIGGRAAAMIWGFHDHVSPLDIYRSVGGHNKRSRVRLEGSPVWPSLVVHRTDRMSPSEVIDVNGVPVTSVARTLWDLASLVSRPKFDRAFNEADRLQLIDDSELGAFLSRGGGHRGSGWFRSRALARIPDIEQAKSVLEGIYLDLYNKKSVPQAELNSYVLGMEVDLVWRGEGVVVELDGYEFHRGREAFERDAMRGNRLKAEGWSVLRVTWRMLHERPKEVAKLIVGVLDQNQSGFQRNSR